MKSRVETKEFVFEIENGNLVFEGDILFGDVKKKGSVAMNPLLYQSTDEDSWNYIFVNGTYKSEEDKKLHQKHDLANGITVVNQGTINGECRKNSGHYHLIAEGQRQPKPELYEVLTGKAAFLIQESHNFDRKDEEIVIDSFRICILEAGEKIIIPPYCAHCCVNVGEGVMAFYNLAGPSPVDYDPITNHGGFAYFLLKQNDILIAVENKKYESVPKLEIVKAKQNVPESGIYADKSVYQAFLEEPEKFNYLNQADEFKTILEK